MMEMMEIKKISVLIIILMALFLQACGSSSASAVNETVTEDTKNTALTIMYYGDADNNLEPSLLEDIAEMKAGYSDAGYNLVTLFDRTPGYSSNLDVFGENFEDTRLYRIGENKSYRLNGGSQFPNITTTSKNYEANMGDANTLKKFIQYCKANYPADKYVLILSNHGGGTRSVKSTSSSITKEICEDVTNGKDYMYTGEISDVLTSSESVDVIVLDACLMGSVEFAYQFRNDSSNTGFKSDYMVASPAVVWGEGLPYTTMLQRIRGVSGTNGTTDTLGGGSSEAYIVPSSTMNMAEFSKMIVEEQYDDTTSENSETFSAYDLSKLTALKTAIDDFAKGIITTSEKIDFESIRGTDSSNTAMNYFDSSDEEEWIEYPFFDIYDLMKKVNNSSKFSDEFKEYANNVQIALGNVILSSFGGSAFTGFTNNKNGMHIIFPKETVSLYDNVSQIYKNYWSLSVLYWYTPIDLNTETSGAKLYGNLSFCSGGVNTEGNSTVDTWFEMIDKWYDNTVANSGKGYNYYKY